ncbi:hypothetical protein MHBO_002410 [Bonamia ostreae]|uniref:Transcription initiation factor TFIID subunit 1 histone acetyltransferase domain-containing protein n=1 Tax=Bonamia ostreae TaxID=126728 RepID=A0ABV2AMA6_9EUKA
MIQSSQKNWYFYYFENPGKRFGPVAREHVPTGNRVLVWCPGMKFWVPSNSVKSLKTQPIPSLQYTQKQTNPKNEDLAAISSDFSDFVPKDDKIVKMERELAEKKLPKFSRPKCDNDISLEKIWLEKSGPVFKMENFEKSFFGDKNPESKSAVERIKFAIKILPRLDFYEILKSCVYTAKAKRKDKITFSRYQKIDFSDNIPVEPLISRENLLHKNFLDISSCVKNITNSNDCFSEELENSSEKKKQTKNFAKTQKMAEHLIRITIKNTSQQKIMSKKWAEFKKSTKKKQILPEKIYFARNENSEKFPEILDKTDQSKQSKTLIKPKSANKKLQNFNESSEVNCDLSDFFHRLQNSNFDRTIEKRFCNYQIYLNLNDPFCIAYLKDDLISKKDHPTNKTINGIKQKSTPVFKDSAASLRESLRLGLMGKSRNKKSSLERDEAHRYKIGVNLNATDDSETYRLNVWHSLLAIKMPKKLYPFRMTPGALRYCHKPKLRSLKNKVVEIIFESKIKSGKNGDPESVADVSAENGEIALFEYIEQRPCFLHNVGMAYRLHFYYREGAANENLPQTGKEETSHFKLVKLKKAEASPFLGEITTKESVLSVDNNLFRAPIARHRNKTTDFMLIRSSEKDKWLIRKIGAIYAVGQLQPKRLVFSPKSQSATELLKNRISSIILEKFLVFEPF